jgi:hypothetical protein
MPSTGAAQRRSTPRRSEKTQIPPIRKVGLDDVDPLVGQKDDVVLGRLEVAQDVQRLNYTLFALVVLHALFYGALRRLTSPFTLVLLVTLVVVCLGQAVGIWLWRRRNARTADAVSRERQRAGAPA